MNAGPSNTSISDGKMKNTSGKKQLQRDFRCHFLRPKPPLGAQLVGEHAQRIADAGPEAVGHCTNIVTKVLTSSTPVLNARLRSAFSRVLPARSSS